MLRIRKVDVAHLPCICYGSFMDAKNLKEWMKKTGWNYVDVASELRISADTVKRFLKGYAVQPIILDAFRRLVVRPIESVKQA